jgi:hypothetical protein
MILAVVVFLSAGQPVLSLRGSEAFETMDACRAFIEREEPRLHIIAAQASAQVGRPVTFTATCLDRRTSA